MKGKSIMTAPDGYIEELMERYHDLLYKHCKRMVHYNPLYYDLINDCIQQTFLKAYIHYDSISRSSNTYGWLYKCCKNNFDSLYRRNKRRLEITGRQLNIDQYMDVKDPTDSIIRWLERESAKTVLNTLKGTLTPLELTVFQDYYENDMTMKETAAQNKISVVSVRAAVERIRAKLKGMTILTIIFILWCISQNVRTV